MVLKKSICRSFKFDAAHLLPGYEGKCQNLHGHTWKVEVVVTGRHPLSYESMVMDFGELKKLVEKYILEQLDHGYINDVLKVPTAENLSEYIYQHLFTVLPSGVLLERVRVWESPDSWAEVQWGT